MESASSRSRSLGHCASPPLPRWALLLLLPCLAASVLGAADLSLRLVCSLLPGSAFVDALADPRAITPYQDCETAAPLATAAPAARPLSLVWVRVHHQGVAPHPDALAASEWIAERFPVSQVDWSVEDLEYAGPETASLDTAMDWAIDALEPRATASGALFVAVLPRLVWSGGSDGRARLGGHACAVLDIAALGRIAGHECGHLLGLLHRDPAPGCVPMMAAEPGDCMPQADFMALWAALFAKRNEDSTP